MGLARESLVVGVTLVLGSGSSVAVERLHLRRGEHARPQPHVIDHPHEVLAVVALAALADDQIVRPHHEVAGVVCGGGLYAVQKVVQVGAWPRTRPVRKAFRLTGGCRHGPSYTMATWCHLPCRSPAARRVSVRIRPNKPHGIAPDPQSDPHGPKTPRVTR